MTASALHMHSDEHVAHANESQATHAYRAPCDVALRSLVICDACGKRVTLQTLHYRHVCFPSVQRVRQATVDAQLAVNNRAEAIVEEEKANKYARFFMR